MDGNFKEVKQRNLKIDGNVFEPDQLENEREIRAHAVRREFPQDRGAFRHGDAPRAEERREPERDQVEACGGMHEGTRHDALKRRQDGASGEREPGGQAQRRTEIERGGFRCGFRGYDSPLLRRGISRS